MAENETLEAPAPAQAGRAMQDAEPRALNFNEIRGRIMLEAPHAWQFIGDQGPILMQYVARMRGLPCVPLSEPFTYCEIGCRNGLTSNVLAASLPQGRFTAIGASAEQVANGKRMAEEAGLDNIDFVACGYDALAQQDLPEFDFITLHGVYSTMTGEDRKHVVELIARKLKPTGLVYVGYNALPGWAPFQPLRQLMTAYAGLVQGEAVAKAERAVRYLKFLRDNDSAFFDLNPLTRRFLDDLARMEPGVVLHEFLAEAWHPLHVSQVAAEMALAKVSYAGSTEVGYNYNDVSVPEPFWPLLESAENEIVRETHKSLILNQMFRRDLYGRGAREISDEERTALFADAVFGSRLPESRISREVTLGRNKLQYGAKIYDDLIPVVAAGRHTLDELCALPALESHGRQLVMTALHRLAVGGQIRPFAAKAPEIDGVPDKVRIAHPLNRALLRERLLRDPSCTLASPVLGTGVAIDLTQGLLLLASEDAPDKPVERAVEILAESGQSFMRDGEEVSDPGQAREVLEGKLAEFHETWVPLLLRFGIVEAA